MKAALLLSLAVLATSTLLAREWTSSEGRKINADFVSATATTVTLKLPNGQLSTLPLTRLSGADNAWIAEQAGKPAAAAPSAPAKPIEGSYASLITGDWALSEYKGLPFALYGSKELSATQKYPLVLALHGRSKNEENGKQVGGWMKSFAKEENYKARPCIIVAPMGLQPWAGEGTAWSEKPGILTIALVKDLVKNLPIDKERIYITGHSMGGYGTCHLITMEPRMFAGAVAMSGCTGPETAAILKKVPLWLFHAADDPTVDVKGARDLAAALKRDKSFKYTEFETGGHGIPPKVYDDKATHEWLFAQGGKK